jgi:hypothetical protein
MKFKCTVKRMQIWRDVVVEAESVEDAKDEADDYCRDDGCPCEDIGYETTAVEVKE